MSRRGRIRSAGIFLIAVVLLGGGLSVLTGHLLTAPAPNTIGAPPADLPAGSVEIPVSDGQAIRGWHTRTKGSSATILLFHPLRASRLVMLGRARFLHLQGYDSLAVDFRAHGESDGDRITLGLNEAKDVSAAVDYIRTRSPDHRIGVIGVSLGGAAALLNGPSLAVDALIAEAAFADLITATKNRLRIRLGAAGPPLSPLLTWQILVFLGFDPLEFSPERAAGGTEYPVLLIYGSEDNRATLAEGRRLASAIGDGARLWRIEGATHQDLHGFAGRRYEERVSAFFARHLQ